MEIERIPEEKQNTSEWSGGTTTELYIYPKSSKYKDRNFKYRFSTAVCKDEESVFTRLEDTDRILLVLDGKIDLEHEDGQSADLSPGMQDAFSGDQVTRSRGTCCDFNLMLKEGTTGKLWYKKIKQGETILFEKEVSFIYVVSGKVTVNTPSENYSFFPHDFVKVKKEEKEALMVYGDTEAVLVAAEVVLKEETKEKTTAQLLVECLENEGVKYIFGIPGEETLELMEAIRHSNIEFITTRHEQGAAFMADVYGRLTGRAGVCLSTLGPGATNLVTGVADATGDGAPLVAITGQVGTERMHITSHQYLDLTKMFEPVTKRTKLVVRPDTISEITRLAFKYAEGERPGASHIDLPVNIAKMKVPVSEQPLKRESVHREMAAQRVIEDVAHMIVNAENIVILAGSQAVRARASKAITRFAEDLRIPVINTMMAKGIISRDNKYALMTVGIPQYDYANKALEEADLVIAVGYDLVEFAPSRWNPDNTKKIVHVSSRPAHINKHYQCDVQAVGDISDTLNRIVDAVNVLDDHQRTEPQELFKIKEEFDNEYREEREDGSFPMKPQRIIYDIRKVLDKNDILVSDVGAHKMWIARFYNCYEPNTCIISNGFATMGIGVPGAISAKLINPEKRIITVTGDGGFMMNSQELETAVRLKLNIVVLIMNDGAYGLIQWKQREQYGETCYTDFTNPDFVKLAQAMHCIGMRVSKADDLLPMLEEAFTKTVPVVIDVAVDYSENLKLTRKLLDLKKEVIM